MKRSNKTPRAKRLYADHVILAFAFVFLCLFAVTETRNLILEHGIHKSSVFRALLLCVICALFYLGAILREGRTHSDRPLRATMILFFLLYVYLLVNLTLLDKSLGRGTISATTDDAARRAVYLERYVNLRPFESIWQVYVKGFMNGYVNTYYTLLNLIGNICALMPLALFLPYFWRKQRKRYVFLGTMLVTVLCIEGLQLLFMVGSCDVDDLILNVGGAYLMYAILRLSPMQRLTEALVKRNIFEKNQGNTAQF